MGKLSVHDIDPLPVRCNPHKRKRELSSSQLGRKWSRLDSLDDDDDEGKSELKDIQFDDLTPLTRAARTEVHDIICRRKPLERISLSHPHRMVFPPPADVQPPPSIHFDTFARKVDNLIANGVLQ